MRHLLDDLGFIIQNWRYLHAHGVLWNELKQWWTDYDIPPPVVRQGPQVRTKFGIMFTPEARAELAQKFEQINLAERQAKMTGYF